MDDTGQMWGLVEPGTRWQLIVRAGASGARMALLNTPLEARKLGLIPEREAFQPGLPRSINPCRRSQRRSPRRTSSRSTTGD
jgi:hypothetical protein